MDAKEVDGDVVKNRDFFSMHHFSSFKKEEIHVWTASLDASIIFFEHCKQALNEVERQRISFYKFEKDQANYVLSQGGIRLLLSSYLRVNPRDVIIGRHLKGKPYCSNDTSLFFNISNSGDRVVYAISRAGEVGIDIEQLRPLKDLDELIEKNFNDHEKKFINLHSEDKLFRFLKFWTVKESYLKAIGEGMRLTPDNLEFTVENNLFKLMEVKGFFESKDWISTNLIIAPDYVGTLTYLGKETQISEVIQL